MARDSLSSRSAVTVRPLLACLATALLMAGSAAAQPAPGTPADAERAAVRLVEAARDRDWLALSVFVDPQTVADVAREVPATAEDLERILSEWATDLSDSLAYAGMPDAGEKARAASLAGRMRALYTAGQPDEQTVMARVLALAAGCDPASPLSLLDPIRYAPVRADVRADGTIEAIGRLSATVDGEVVEGLIATPLRWSESCWIVADVAPEARDIELNPVARFLALGPYDWAYAPVAAVLADVNGTMPGCVRE